MRETPAVAQIIVGSGAAAAVGWEASPTLSTPLLNSPAASDTAIYSDLVIVIIDRTIVIMVNYLTNY